MGGILGCAGNDIQVYILNSYTVGDITGEFKLDGIYGSDNIKYEVIQKNCYTQKDTFTAKDLGSAFKEDTKGINNGYPILYWE